VWCGFLGGAPPGKGPALVSRGSGSSVGLGRAQKVDKFSICRHEDLQARQDRLVSEELTDEALAWPSWWRGVTACRVVVGWQVRQLMEALSLPALQAKLLLRKYRWDASQVRTTLTLPTLAGPLEFALTP
jgi:hypothetical protein